MIAPDPILRLEDVSKHFGGLAVVENLSFAVRRGSCTALIGPNGAGKTTVFNLITGVHQVDAGRIMLDDTDIAPIPSRYRIRHGVAPPRAIARPSASNARPNAAQSPRRIASRISEYAAATAAL